MGTRVPWKQEERLENSNPRTYFSLHEGLLVILDWPQERVQKCQFILKVLVQPCIGSVPASLVILEVIFFIFCFTAGCNPDKSNDMDGGLLIYSFNNQNNCFFCDRTGGFSVRVSSLCVRYSLFTTASGVLDLI